MHTYCDIAHTLCQSDWHYQAWHSIFTPAIKVCNHFQHQIWIRSHYRLVSKVQTWLYWPGQISFLLPWMFWKLLYAKCTLNHFDTKTFSVQSLSRQVDIHKFTDLQQCISLCVFILVPLPSIHFSPSMTGGGGRQWQGSLHHKTPAGHGPQQLPHKITDTLSTSKWTGPVWHTADAGRVRGKVEWQNKRNHRRDWEEEGGMGQKGRRNRKKAPRGRPGFAPWVQTLTILTGHTWHLCLYDPDNVCLNMERLQKVKGQASIDAALVSATSELLLTPQRPGTYFLLAMNSTNGFNQ